MPSIPQGVVPNFRFQTESRSQFDIFRKSDSDFDLSVHKSNKNSSFSCLKLVVGHHMKNSFYRVLSLVELSDYSRINFSS